MKKKRKLGRKLLSFLLALAMVVGLMPGMGLTAYAATHDHTGWTEWTGNNSLPTNAGNYYLTQDVTLTNTWSLNTTGTFNLCLNGHKIVMSGSKRVIALNTDSTLTLNLYDEGNTGTITGGNANGYDGGGMIIGNNVTVNMYGGCITGNTAGNGGGVHINGNGTLNMYGGSITGNTASYYGGGVYVTNAYATFNVSGNVNIENNTLTSDNSLSSNVYLYGSDNLGYSVIKVIGALDSATHIGVTCVKDSGTIVEGVGEIKASDYAGNFFSDLGYTLKADNDKLVISSHTHSFTYSADGAKITATCGNTGCTLTANPTLTIVKPTLETYGEAGKIAAASLTGLTDFNTATGKAIAATEIKYVGRDGTSYTESTTAPNKAGKYTAKITLSGVKTRTGDNQNVTASVDYEIAKATTTVSTAPTAGEITYGKTLADSALTGGTASVAGTFAWKDSTVAPAVSDSQKTEYDVVFTPTDANYSTAECKVKLTVNKAAATVTAPTSKTLTYTGSAQELVTAGTATGGEMQYALGTATKATEPYTTSIPKATNAGTYYVWYKVDPATNYNGVNPACIVVEIKKNETSTTTPTEKTEPTTKDESVTVYRLYYGPTMEHFYTTSAYERKVLIDKYGWVDEGIAWKSPKAPTTDTEKKTIKPVYRLFNPFTTDHHYTKDANERKTLINKYGWKDEGVAFYSNEKGDATVYRLWHPGLITGAHHFTTGKHEYDVLITRGWIGETEAFKVNAAS